MPATSKARTARLCRWTRTHCCCGTRSGGPNNTAESVKGRKAVFNRAAIPATDLDWAQLAQVLLLGLARRSEQESVLNPLLAVLFAVAWRNGAPRSAAELADRWWDTPSNWCRTNLTDHDFARQLSDRYLNACLAMFGDTGAWTTRQGRHVGTEIGWDLAIVLAFAAEDGGLDLE